MVTICLRLYQKKLLDRHTGANLILKYTVSERNWQGYENWLTCTCWPVLRTGRRKNICSIGQVGILRLVHWEQQVVTRSGADKMGVLGLQPPSFLSGVTIRHASSYNEYAKLFSHLPQCYREYSGFPMCQYSDLKLLKLKATLLLAPHSQNKGLCS